MKLGAVIFPVPTMHLPFVVHLLDYVMYEVTLKAGIVGTKELTLANKACLPTALQCSIHLGYKGNLPR
jgi:hypothetical protein